MNETRSRPVPAQLSYWIVPSESFLAPLQTTVSNLAATFNGPAFIPHVTVYYDRYTPDDPVADILAALADTPEVELRAKALRFTDQFTQSCFIQFEPSPRLVDMCERIRHSVRSPGTYQVVPHMSLFYGVLTEQQRDTVRQTVSFPETIRFDLLTAIANPPRVASREDVEYWYELDRRRLQALR